MSYKRETLEGKTSKELKYLCANKLGLPGMSKKLKNEVIDAIIAKQGSSEAISKEAPSGQLKEIGGSFQSTMTNQNSPWGERIGTTIQVSCGANTGKFPVTGRTITEVGEFLREVLNVEKLSTGLINGKAVAGNYIIKVGDVVEFLKPAGSKG